MKSAPEPITQELVVKHWQMLYHLVWELQRCEWPYAPEGFKYLRGKYGFKELFDYVKTDPRFIAEGLEWRQPPCAFYYGREVEVAALGLFLGKYVGTGTQGHVALNKWLYIEVKSGNLRDFVEKELRKHWREYDRSECPDPNKVPHSFDFMDPSLFSSERVI